MDIITVKSIPIELRIYLRNFFIKNLLCTVKIIYNNINYNQFLELHTILLKLHLINVKLEI